MSMEAILKSEKNKLIRGTIILTIAGIISRIIGFVYKIYLADFLGAKLLGIYQLIFPVYGICFTIYGAGLQTAISQYVGEYSDNTGKYNQKQLRVLSAGTFAGLLLSLILAFLVYTNSDNIADHFLLEKTCSQYIQILTIIFPFCSVSACISGFYYGVQNASSPAIAQIIEQMSRVIFVIPLCMFISGSSEQSCIIALYGMAVGEISGFLFNILRLLMLLRKRYTRQSAISQNNIVSKLLKTAFILTGTRLIISILHSAEAVFIPSALQKYGLSSSEALSTYGILSGMSFPFILFPSAICVSFATMILPTMAKANSDKNETKIRTTVTFTTKYSLIIGWLFTTIFLFYGSDIGNMFFHNETAGEYIKILSWLCPLLYVSTTLTSIINGLGHTQYTFLITAISLIIKIYFLIFLVPKKGISAYLIGTLISQLIITVMEIIFLRKYITYDASHFVLLPFISLIFLGVISKKLYSAFLQCCPQIPEIIIFLACCAIITVIYAIWLLITHCIKTDEFKVS